MWNSLMSKSDNQNGNDDNSSRTSSSRRKDDEDRKSTSSRHRSDSLPSASTARISSWGDDRERGFNPSSMSFSSTSQSAFPGTAAPSVASSYATAITGGDNRD